MALRMTTDPLPVIRGSAAAGGTGTHSPFIHEIQSVYVTSGVCSYRTTRVKGEHVTEQEAVARLKQGDIAALEVLVRAYQRQAAQVAYLVVGDWQTAEDITQASFLELHTR